MKKCNTDCYGECQRNIYVSNNKLLAKLQKLTWIEKPIALNLLGWQYQYNEFCKKLNKCIVHCEKNIPNKNQTLNDIYQKDRNSSLLSDFYDNFIDYTVEKLFEHNEVLGNKLDKNNLKQYFQSNKFTNEEYNNFLKNTIFTPNCIHFPTRDSRDYFDYLKILNLFGKIHFNYCEFYLSDLNLKDTECFFQDCKFHYKWTLYDYKLLEDTDCIYDNCKFYQTVSNYISEKSNQLAIYRYSQFNYACTFKENLNFDRSNFKNSLFKTEQDNYQDNKYIQILKFNKCIFEKEFKLNNYSINEFILDSSIFEDIVEFKNNSILNVNILSTTFKQVSNFINSEFTNLYVSNSIFNDNVDFQDSIFGIKYNVPRKTNHLIQHSYLNDKIRR